MNKEETAVTTYRLEMDTLRKIVEEATPGPWVQDGWTTVFAGGCGCTGSLVAATAEMGAPDAESKRADTCFIATFDPSMVGRLLDAIDRLGRGVDDYLRDYLNSGAADPDCQGCASSPDPSWLGELVDDVMSALDPVPVDSDSQQAVVRDR